MVLLEIEFTDKTKRQIGESMSARLAADPTTSIEKIMTERVNSVMKRMKEL